ncbi:MAG: hypothetical protein KAV98_04765 [Dehalococcoidia bacterium]|nr:hypothetical protein [Dehalococcoidia bacterium]
MHKVYLQMAPRHIRSVKLEDSLRLYRRIAEAEDVPPLGEGKQEEASG